MDTVKSKNSKVYYRHQYWNNIPIVLEYICENYTGNKQKWWIADFKERYCEQPFEHALVMMCGNGWVERELYDKGIARQFSAFDYLEDLLEKARAKKAGRRIHYFQADANLLELEENKYDLIVNVAAMHHVQYINRMCRMLCWALKPEGVFVNTDYIGPHRNQYSQRHWHYVKKINAQLPQQYRKQSLNKPRLGTMLHMDPSEAIHSELTIETITRYFDIVERHDTNGGVAYPLLTRNRNISKELTPDMEKWVQYILQEDRKYTEAKKVPPLFSYFIAHPRKTVLQNDALLNACQLEENAREAKAAKRDGIYSLSAYYQYRVKKWYRQTFKS
ncbi:MAG TPA: class I SAM-dependent methyltransferase [Crenotrichaceae bacterium]|nr:class I SAM-dependent methyltransferase [Crenotrichaceae bacterium]